MTAPFPHKPLVSDDPLENAIEWVRFNSKAVTIGVIVVAVAAAGVAYYRSSALTKETRISADLVALYNEYHALIVRHGKDVCRTRPRCAQCCLARRCPSNIEEASSN